MRFPTWGAEKVSLLGYDSHHLVRCFPKSLAPSSEVRSLVMFSLTSIWSTGYVHCLPSHIICFEVSITSPFSPSWWSIWQIPPKFSWLLSTSTFLFSAYFYWLLLFSHTLSLLSYSLRTSLGYVGISTLSGKGILISWKDMGTTPWAGSLLWVKDFDGGWVWQPCPWFYTCFKSITSKTFTTSSCNG